MIQKKVKYVIISDTHLGQYNKTNTSRCKKIIKYFNLLLDEIYQHSVDNNYEPFLIIGGDVLHSINISPDILEYIFKEVSFDKFKNVKIISGNHEVFTGQEADETTLLPVFYSDEKFKVYMPGKWFLEDKTLYIPHSINIEDEINFINKSSQIKEIDDMYGHFTSVEVFEKEKVNLSKLFKKKKIKFCFLGHYHTPLDLEVDTTKLYSIGSTYYSNISEIEKSDEYIKRYLVYDPEESKVESIPIKTLPEIKRFEVEDQDQLKDIFVGDTECIYYIKSKLPLDLTMYTSMGYDIYFRYEPNDDKLINVMEAVDIEKDKTVDINDSWYKYLNMQRLDSKLNELCDYAFQNRIQLNEEILYNQLLERRD